MLHRFNKKLQFIYDIIHINILINIIYTIQRSLARQNRSKDLDSPTLYHGKNNLDTLSEYA
jgi:hypothetical protein